MGAVTILADVQGNVAALIAAAQNVDADKKFLFFFDFRYVCYGQGKEKTKNIQGVFVEFAVGKSIWVTCTSMAGCRDGPDETYRVGNVVSWLATVV